MSKFEDDKKSCHACLERHNLRRRRLRQEGKKGKGVVGGLGDANKPPISAKPMLPSEEASAKVDAPQQQAAKPGAVQYSEAIDAWADALIATGLER